MNIEAYKITFKPLMLSSDIEYQINGRLTINRVLVLLEDPLVTCDKIPISALLLDYEMPEANGLVVVREVKAAYKKLNAGRNALDMIREPLYVFMSAHLGNKAFVNKCREEGVQHFYSKPIDVRSLRSLSAKIKSHVEDL